MTVYVGPDEYPFYFHKGRLCQDSSYFETAFHGSFHEATSGSIYLEEDGVEEFRLFEEWVYSDKLNYPKDSDDSSLLLVKVFCFAEKIGVSGIQNATLDAIRDRAVEQHPSLPAPNTAFKPPAIPLVSFGSTQRPTFYQTEAPTASSAQDKPTAKCLPTATATAITYAYENTREGSPLRKLLADIFAYDVKPKEIQENILSFPPQFIADVLLITMKRLPFRINTEKADFDKDAKEYYVQESSSTRQDRIQRTPEDANGIDHPPAGPAPEQIPEPPALDEDETLAFGSSSKLKSKKKGKRISKYDDEMT